MAGTAKRAAERNGQDRSLQTNIKRKVEKTMGIEPNVQAAGGVPQDVKAGIPQSPAATAPFRQGGLMAALMQLLQEGVQSGDADADVPQVIEKLIDSGADVAAVLAALKQAVEAGKVSPLMLAKAEKLLNAPAADETTDRTQILRGNRNQLVQ